MVVLTSPSASCLIRFDLVDLVLKVDLEQRQSVRARCGQHDSTQRYLHSTLEVKLSNSSRVEVKVGNELERETFRNF